MGYERSGWFIEHLFNRANKQIEYIVGDGKARCFLEKLDEYNYFFMYNPFQGKTFDNVVCNLQESYNRKHRQITLIYSGTYCHNSIVENSTFKLSKTIYTDYSVRYVNICTMND